MTERAIQYGKVLFSLGLSDEVITTAKHICFENDVLIEAFCNPSVKIEEKHRVIDKLFPKEICGFLKVVTDNNVADQLEDIFEACEDCVIDSKNYIKATFYYVTKPSEEQLEAVKAKICKEYHKDGVELICKEDPSLVGGFVLKVNDFETDRSIKGQIEQLTNNLVRR